MNGRQNGTPNGIAMVIRVASLLCCVCVGTAYGCDVRSADDSEDQPRETISASPSPDGTDWLERLPLPRDAETRRVEQRIRELVRINAEALQMDETLQLHEVTDIAYGKVRQLEDGETLPLDQPLWIMTFAVSGLDKQPSTPPPGLVYRATFIYDPSSDQVLRSSIGTVRAS